LIEAPPADLSGSGRRHGVPDEDIADAYLNALA
jgi:hypothetical protein